MDKWMVAVCVLTDTKNGTSSDRLGRSLGVTQKSAWFMLQRIRQCDDQRNFRRRCPVKWKPNETLIGQKARNMHKHVLSYASPFSSGSERSEIQDHRDGRQGQGDGGWPSGSNSASRVLIDAGSPCLLIWRASFSN
jgi:hypothetical protein